MSEKLYGILLQEAIPTPDKPQKIKNLLVNKEAKELIEKQSKEIERLTKLCNKYEEEHKTTFETWQKDIKENEQLHSIIKEAREIFKYYGAKEDIVGYSNYTITGEDLLNLLEILDKVGSENNGS